MNIEIYNRELTHVEKFMVRFEHYIKVVVKKFKK